MEVDSYDFNDRGDRVLTLRDVGFHGSIKLETRKIVRITRNGFRSPHLVLPKCSQTEALLSKEWQALKEIVPFNQRLMLKCSSCSVFLPSEARSIFLRGREYTVGYTSIVFLRKKYHFQA
mmetsp:Transcript_28300/g.70975  ORF Transcript_28300/g.70975 Transcript_28300/m.70975 type:complete len:120 (+) Transcript_28300:361-720(+)